MDWFERLTGFRETGYADTRKRLRFDGRTITSTVNGASYSAGELELVALSELRERVVASYGPSGRLKIGLVSGDVRDLHQAPESVGTLFQVASQFNLLEMASPDLTPEQGVAIYQNDPTQGPACAIAAGAATIFRNYFAPVDGASGQTAGRQLNGLADLGVALSQATGQPVESLWTMCNGYALATRDGLDRIAQHLGSIGEESRDALRGKLRIGVHRDVEVTDANSRPYPVVSQAFCSALPVAYGDAPSKAWAALAVLVLEAAYEATIWAAVLNARRGASNVVLLTRLGGGVFGNEDEWIDSALRRALMKAADFDLDVRIVSRGAPSKELRQLVSEFA